ncbi:MAG: DUF6022 family protein, partial [Firmicutes bacterium]|nr:DUF6022 family protein [Bacillota bacterium]
SPLSQTSFLQNINTGLYVLWRNRFDPWPGESDHEYYNRFLVSCRTDVAQMLADQGYTLRELFPGTFARSRETVREDGVHQRLFSCAVRIPSGPVRFLLTMFFHRHDNLAIPQSPQVIGWSQETPAKYPKED